VPPEHDDPLGTETSSGDHAAQTHGAVTDHGYRRPDADARSQGGMVTGRHHIRECQ
jgi:hypothetical protein